LLPFPGTISSELKTLALNLSYGEVQLKLNYNAFLCLCLQF
jgi:hypothetical protein